MFDKVKERAMKARFAVIPLMLSAVMTAPALATDANGDSGMTAVLGTVTTISSLLDSVWTLMTSNPLLTLFLGVSLLTVGIRVFRRVRGAARG